MNPGDKVTIKDGSELIIDIILTHHLLCIDSDGEYQTILKSDVVWIQNKLF
jgi:hypothetical protein